MDLGALIFLAIATLWRRRYLAIIPILIMPPLSYVVGLLAPQAYQASTTILVQETAKLNPFLNDLAVGPNLKERMPALITLVHSEHILESVLRDTGEITNDTSPSQKAQRIRQLSSAINVQLNGTDLVAFKIKGSSGIGMAKTLTALSKRFIDRLLAPERSAIVDSQQFLTQELQEREKRLREAQSIYATFKSANSNLLPNLESGHMTRLTQLEQRLADNNMAQNASKAELSDVTQRLIGTNPVIGRIEDDIMKTRHKLGDLQTKYTPAHTAVIAATRKLKRLRLERETMLRSAESMQGTDLDSLWNIAIGTIVDEEKKAPPLLIAQMTRLQESKAMHQRLKGESEALKSEIKKLQKIIADTGPVAQQQRRLDENINFAQRSYDAIAKRFDNAEITGALGKFEAPERIKIIDYPFDPVVPITPGRLLFLLAGIVGGIFAGAGLAVAAEMLDTRLRTVETFEKISNAPVIARYNGAICPITGSAI